MRSGEEISHSASARVTVRCAPFLPLSSPRCALYLISDGLALLAGKVLRYRRRVVRENLGASFPEMTWKRSAAKSSMISIAFRRLHSGDRENDIHEREPDTPAGQDGGPGAAVGALRRGRDVTLLLGHYCNWEWLSSIPLHIPENSVGAKIYHPLSNAAFDRLFGGHPDTVRLGKHRHGRYTPPPRGMEARRHTEHNRLYRRTRLPTSTSISSPTSSTATPPCSLDWSESRDSSTLKYISSISPARRGAITHCASSA